MPQGELFARLLHVENAYRERANRDNELLRYFPIAVVGCIESFYRLAIKALVDSVEPYLTNAKALFTNIKTGFEVLQAMHGQTITVGDLVAHSLKISNLSHVSSHMDQLLGDGYLKNLGSVRDRWKVEVHGAPDQPILDDSDETFRWVSRAFELRHIFCYELATNHDVEPSDIESAFEHSLLFLKASEELVSETLYPNAPLTQLDMNVTSGKEYREERAKLDGLLADLAARVSGKQATKIEEANAAWEAYFEAAVEAEGLTYEGGSIRPMIQNLAAARLVRDRAKQVTELIESITLP